MGTLLVRTHEEVIVIHVPTPAPDPVRDQVPDPTPDRGRDPGRDPGQDPGHGSGREPVGHPAPGPDGVRLRPMRTDRLVALLHDRSELRVYAPADLIDEAVRWGA